MTNELEKQIIIDGVDVKDCKRRIGKDNFCRYYKRPCAENSYNCIWKKYLRKEQECEEMKKKLKPKLKNAHCAYFEGQTGLCKAKEFKRCNPVNCKLYTIDGLSTIVDLQQRLDQLKADREEALKQLKFVRTLNTIQETKIRKLTKTLAEIKEIAKNNFYYLDCDYRWILEQILQKISEVDNEN